MKEHIRVTTLSLRPLVQTIIENQSSATLIKDVTFEWEEYRATSSWHDNNGNLQPTLHRIPQGGIAPPVAFVSRCLQFLDDSGLHWRPEWLGKLESGSADAEACLLLLALPNLRTLRLNFDKGDGDELYMENDLDFQHLFRHEMLCAMIRDPKAFAATSEPLAQFALQNLSKFVLSQPYDDPWTIKASYPPCLHVDLDKVKGMFKLPNLQSLEMCQIGNSDEEVFDEPADSSLFRSTKLNKIILTKASLSADELEYFLRFPKSLKYFHYHVVSPDELFARHTEDSVEPELTSPKLLLTGVYQHKDSLEYLHINSINGRSWWGSQDDDRFHGDQDSDASDCDPADDGQAARHEERQSKVCKDIKQKYIQPIDLHEFSVLKTLSVHATDLLGAMNKADAADYIALSEILPPALEVLSLRYSNFFSDWDPQLDFIYESCLGFGESAHWTVEGWVTRDHWVWYETYFRHLSQLLLHKKEKFPQLKEIEVYLDDGWPKPGKEIMELANDVGVAVVVKDLEEEAPRTFL